MEICANNDTENKKRQQKKKLMCIETKRPVESIKGFLRSPEKTTHASVVDFHPTMFATFVWHFG
jgi:hypothetical protein